VSENLGYEFWKEWVWGRGERSVRESLYFIVAIATIVFEIFGGI
jgi:hypothetical protein